MLSADGQRQLQEIIKCSEKVFLPNADGKIAFTPYLQHKIPLAEDKVIRVPGLRIPHAWRSEVNKQVHELIKRGAVERSLSAYLTPLVAVKKPNGKLRLVLDFRFLNAITVGQASVLIPNVNETFDSLYGKKFFTVLDLRDAYHSIEIYSPHRKCTAFQNVDGQILQWVALPFGLSAAPATFSILMAHILQGAIGKFAHNYLDDILIYSDTEEQHLRDIDNILQRLVAANLKISSEKCIWAAETVDFLGHSVSKEGLRPKAENVNKIRKLQPLKDVKGVRNVYGILSY